jgi:hypothetical protein
VPDSFAGPSYGLGWKALRSDLIVEIEFTVLPKSQGWKAADAEARKAKILRTIFKRAGVKASTKYLHMFPFSNDAACWPDAPTKARFLVFLTADGNEMPMGLEDDEGGYSSFNPDYEDLVSAISIAAHWDKDRDRESDWAPQRKVARNRNRYLRALAIHFLQEQKADALPMTMSKKQLAEALYPVGSCTRRPR